MPLAGNLRQYALTDVLRMIEHGQRSGALTLARGQLRAIVYFSGGQWLLAERVGATASLAHQLAQAGYISAEQFEAVLGMPSGQAAAIQDMQMVRALINARMLSQEQLRTFTQQDAVALLTVLLSWPDADFLFEDEVRLPPGRVALPLPVSSLVTQALQQVRVTMPPREVTPLAPEMVIEFADVDPDSGMAIQLTREQWRFLTAVDGASPLWSIIQTLNAPEPTILRLAAELVASGVLTIAKRAAPA